MDEVAQVTDNTITDSGNLSLDNILHDGVVDIDDTANGNNTNVDVSPNADSDVDADISADTTTDGSEDNEGLLGGLLQQPSPLWRLSVGVGATPMSDSLVFLLPFPILRRRRWNPFPEFLAALHTPTASRS
ncbi:hypothetical protein [Arthrobacter sp. D2-10]